MRGPGERIEDKKLARVVWAVVGLSIALQLTGSILDSVQGSSDDTSPIESLAMFIAFATFPVVGAILVSRGQRHALSWVMIAIGVLSSAGVFAMTYAHRALVLDPGSLPGGTFAAWIEASFWLPLLELIVLFLVMFFPDGKLVSRRWRPLLWVSSALLVVSTLAPMFQARLATDSYDIANPVGVSFIESIESIGWMLVLLGLTGIGALASLIVRFHRSQGVERLQMKWFTFAAGGHGHRGRRW